MNRHFTKLNVVHKLSEKRSKRPDVIGIVTLGFLLLLVGMIFAITPNLIDRISDFLRDFEIRELAPNWKLPTPKSHHLLLYTAAFQFCLAFAIFQILVLAARFILRDPIDRISGTISSIVFWFGASWLVNLLITETIEWFVFFGLLIALIGTSVIIKSVIGLIARILRKTQFS